MMNTNKKYTFYLEITTSCNFSCPFCPSSKKETHYYMNEKDIYHIIDEIGNHIEIIYFHVLGEPFLHPNFIDILNYVESKKIYFGITTNGALLNNFKEEMRNVKEGLESWKEKEKIVSRVRGLKNLICLIDLEDKKKLLSKLTT